MASSSRDHPRVRGEKTPSCRRVATLTGSPPRARGKVSVPQHGGGALGITPACAGKSAPSRRHQAPTRDHPRVRGEKVRLPEVADRVMGSPPRARGKVPMQGTDWALQGITPACAGKSLRRYGRCQHTEDHPRVRGEKNSTPSHSSISVGSPPRARGKEKFGDEHEAIRGITPACAGKSGCHLSSPPPFGDHPRVRGEKKCRCAP